MTQPSGLDRIIPPEISHDRFYAAITAVAATPGVRQILEIGASAGAGSTEAWVAGAQKNPVRPTIHCIEVSQARFAALAERWRGHDFVRCYNVSSVPVESFPSEAEIIRWQWRHLWSRFGRKRRAKVLGWLRQDLRYLEEHGLSGHGIREVRRQAGVDVFDAVLIDGSEFTGLPELDEVYGARFLLLDDTESYKCWDAFRRLKRDRAYRLVERGQWTRNGFAVFERVT
ncbi:MAG: hypothetical protein A2085_07270 [Gemmatimonadetes bacterium GWC2_71_10]|nr:MAG: hypothetical protein A2085_07270 [Gemmatimonadetes bacterium GWC2_71_10]